MNNFVLLVAIFLYWWQRLLSSSNRLDIGLHILEENVAEIEVRFTQHYLISIIYTTLFFQKEGSKK